jgi:hypothetical protein
MKMGVAAVPAEPSFSMPSWRRRKAHERLGYAQKATSELNYADANCRACTLVPHSPVACCNRRSRCSAKNSRAWFSAPMRSP